VKSGKELRKQEEKVAKVVQSKSKVEKWQKAKEGESESRSGTGHVQKWPSVTQTCRSCTLLQPILGTHNCRLESDSLVH
jgi:hypothetical protein